MGHITVWNGKRAPSNAWVRTTPFEKAEARGRVRRPPQRFFAEVWRACLDDIDNLQNSAKKFDEDTARSILQDGEIKIRHQIFEVRLYAFRFHMI
jgi:hypothetical protein